MKLSEKEVVIMNEDLKLFKYLFETDFLTREQIHQFIWPRRGQSYIDLRLWQLTREKYLKKAITPLGGQKETVLMGDRKALMVLKIKYGQLKDLVRASHLSLYDYDPDEYMVQNKLDLATVYHDYLLNIVRFTLEKAGASYWMTAKMLARRKTFDINPDGVFQVYDSKTGRVKVFAVELEMSRKDRRRYIGDSYGRNESEKTGIFLRYVKCEKIDFVLYIAPPLVYNMLASLINPQRITFAPDAYRKFYLIHLDDFLSGDMDFVNPVDRNLKLYMKEILTS